ncbi:hypothetical protein FGO68_gene448 [Halteria grandinella]|uniref:Uncharacterized protein n=1 Tax=Halteria grandinella TaxID=5974 RepID=A0A8J8NZK4_HALGN|nr:hypothetical protein FGO68_gene448 [Halteria grandinella]
MFDWSETTVRVNFQPVRFVPYEQWVAWVRPDSVLFGDQNQWAFMEKGDEDWAGLIPEKSSLLELFDIWTGGTQNTKYLRKSLSQPFLSQESLWFSKEEFAFDKNREVIYQDKWAYVDFERVLGWVFGGTPAIVRGILGERKLWWGESMMGKDEYTFIPK